MLSSSSEPLFLCLTQDYIPLYIPYNVWCTLRISSSPLKIWRTLKIMSREMSRLGHSLSNSLSLPCALIPAPLCSHLFIFALLVALFAI